MGSMYRAERIDIRDGHGPEDAERVAALLRQGRVGVVPTDTVYGIAACALDHEAVRRVLEIKARPADKPLPLQVPGSEEAGRLADTGGVAASLLMSRFWPGALTLVLPVRRDIELPFQGKETIGLRVPDHRFMLDVLDLCWPLVVPSANPPGEAAPRSASEVVPSILEAVDFVVDSGPCPGGVESTVVDVTGVLRVLREGALTAREIMECASSPLEGAPTLPSPLEGEGQGGGVLPLRLLFLCTGNICRSPMAEGMARYLVGLEHPEFAEAVRVGSAGVAALVGQGPTRETEAVMAAQGIDISAHRARSVERAMLEGSDLVLAMEDRQTRIALSIAPNAQVHTLVRAAEVAETLCGEPGALDGIESPAERLRLLRDAIAVTERGGAWAKHPGEYDIEDPYGRARDFYEWAAYRLEDPVRSVLDAMFGRRPGAQ